MEISKAEMASAATAANSAASSSSPVDLRGGEILVKALQAENVKYIWGYPGGAVLHIYDAFFKQNTIQVLKWTRNADGFMTLHFDGKPVLEAGDRGFRDPFDGFSLINRGGEYGLASIRIDGTG